MSRQHRTSSREVVFLSGNGKSNIGRGATLAIAGIIFKLLGSTDPHRFSISSSDILFDVVVIVGFLFVGTGLFQLAKDRFNRLRSAERQAPSSISADLLQTARLPPCGDTAPNRVDYDRRRWEALIQYDDDLANAVRHLSRYGDKWIHQFAHDYLAIDDRSYLARIVEKIEERAEAEAQERQAP